MNLVLTPELEAALNESARRKGVAPRDLALEILLERFPSVSFPLTPADEWERMVIGAAVDCGRPLPDSAMGSEGLYE